jgi:hypothetical protein
MLSFLAEKASPKFSGIKPGYYIPLFGIKKSISPEGIGRLTEGFFDFTGSIILFINLNK